MTLDLEDRVTFDLIDYHVLPKERYPKSFMLRFFSEVCQERGVLHGGTWRTFSVIIFIILENILIIIMKLYGGISQRDNLDDMALS